MSWPNIDSLAEKIVQLIAAVLDAVKRSVWNRIYESVGSITIYIL